MRFLSVFFVLVLAAHAAGVPPELSDALKTFRADNPFGWRFTMATESGGESLVESYDPLRPMFQRWVLLKKNGRTPTDGEVQDYNQNQSLRSSGAPAPPIIQRLDLSTIETVSDMPAKAVYHFKLQPGNDDDEAARHLTVTLELDKATRTIDRVELASNEPFWPTFGVHIIEMHTVLIYSLPAGGRPSFLLRVTVEMRGRAFLFKSLDQDMAVTYSDYEKIQPHKSSPAP